MSLQYGQYPYKVDEIPLGFCNSPTNFIAELNGNIVTLSWVPAHAVLYYILRIIRISDNSVVWSGNFNGSRYITQLAATTNYRAELETVCSDDPLRKAAATLTVNFTTGAHVVQCLPVNVGTVLFTMQVDSVLVTWPANADALAYTLYYKLRNSLMAFEKVATQTNKVELRMTVPNTEYEYYIVTSCKDGKQATSEHGFFQTPLDSQDCPLPVINVVLNGTTAVVVWQFNGLHSAYDVYLNGVIYLANYPSNIVNLTELAALTQYNIAVVGRCNGGNSIAGTKSFTTGSVACPTPHTITHEASNGTTIVQWAAVLGALDYNVTINGSTQMVAVPTVSFPYIPSTKYTIEVKTRCAQGESSPATYEFIAPAGCLAVKDTDIVVTASPLSIKLDWNDLPGVQYYRWRFRIVSGVWSDWTRADNSDLTKEGLTHSTDYQFEIESNCGGSVTNSVTKNVSTTGLIPGIKPVITSFINKTDSSFCVNFTLPDGRLMGNFVAKVRDTITNATTEHGGNLTQICISGKVQHRVYEVIIEDRRPGYTIVPSDPVNVTTCYTCAKVTGLTAVFEPDGDIKVDWTAALGATEYKVWSREMPDTSPLRLETTTAGVTHTIAGANFAYRAIIVQSIFTDCNTSCSETVTITCPKASNLVASIEGNIANLTWKAIPGVYGYKITIKKLGDPDIEEVVTTPAFSIDELAANSTFSYTVIVICIPGIEGPESDPFTFNTGNGTSPDTGCEAPIIEALWQDSDLADPDGGGTTVDNSAAGIINYTTYQSDTFDRSMEFRKQDNITVIDITGYAFEMRIYNMDNTLRKEVSTALGTITVNGPAGKIGLYISEADMTLIPIGTYTYTVEWTTPANVAKIVVKGNFIVKPPLAET